jgi:predicted aspartyl protease
MVGDSRNAMKIRVHGGLPYVDALLEYRGHALPLENVLIDTGSAGVILPTDHLVRIGLTYEPEDMVHRIRGAGGSEFVYTKRVDRLSIGELHVADFEVEVGARDYGFDISGIVGMDFLTKVGAVVDLARLEISQSASL